MRRIWKTLKVPLETYTLVKGISDSTGENLGDVVAAMVGDSASDLRESVNGLVKMAEKPDSSAAGVLNFLTGAKPAPRKVGTATPRGVNAALEGGTNDEADEADEADERVTASYRNGDERNSYECNYCLHRWMVGTEPKSPCPECGKELVYPSDNPSEGNEGGMSGGEKAALFGVAVIALFGFARWQAARRAAASGVNNGMI